MKLSDNLKAAIEYDLFNSSAYSSFFRGLDFYYPKYNKHNVFNKFLELYIPKNKQFFMPLFYWRHLIHCICNNLNFLSEEQTGIRLYYALNIGGVAVGKTADTIMQAMCKHSDSSKLYEVTTSKNLKYYVGNGMALDNNWNLIAMCGITCTTTPESSYLEFQPACKIDPSVFVKEDILSKGLVKKFIPHISNNGVRLGLGLGTVSSNNDYYTKIPILIEPLDKYICNITEPSNVETLNNSIWDCISNNIQITI